MPLEHRQILHLYNTVIRGYINYYSFVHNFGIMTSSIVHILKSSCAKLLAAKFTLKTQAKVYEKFGKDLTYISREKNIKSISFIHPSYKITLKYLINCSPMITTLYGNKSIASLDNLTCSMCSSDFRVEMHHVRALKDLNPKLSLTDKLMIKKQRKQIPLCRECHMKLHNKKKLIDRL